MIKRSSIKRRVTKRATFLKEAAMKAKEVYFTSYNKGFEVEGYMIAPCQISGRPMSVNACDWAHLHRRWKGRNTPADCVIANRQAHQWLDARPEREKFARESGISAQSGGVIPWPAEMKASLELWLNEGIDKINLGRK